MGATSELIFWVVLMGIAVAFLYIPQLMARRRRQKRIDELTVGDRVLTIGGFIGTLTYFEPESDVARIRLAEGIEVEVLPGAISGKHQPPSAEIADADEEV